MNARNVGTERDYELFYVPLKNFSLYINGEGLQNFGLCSALTAFEQGGIFIVPHLLTPGSSEDGHRALPNVEMVKMHMNVELDEFVM
jgi:hypothetical protein